MLPRSTRSLSHSCERNGFTLLEVLLALSLCALLLGAVYMSLSLHWKYTTAGRDEVERSQLARAVLNRITLDLRSALYRAPPADESAESAAAGSSSSPGTASGGTGTGSGGTGTGSGSGTGGGTGGGSGTGTGTASTPAADTTLMTEETADPTAAQSPGLYGNSETLMVYISQPSKTLDYAPLFDAERAGHRTSDQQTVSWFLARRGGFGLAGAVGMEREGMARTSGDSLSTKLADEQGNLAALVQQTRVLAPEVTRLQFRYYDGISWQTAWDSAKFGGLPRLVEVTIEVQSAAARTAKSGSSPPPQPQEFQVVIVLPASKPLAL